MRDDRCAQRCDSGKTKHSAVTAMGADSNVTALTVGSAGDISGYDTDVTAMVGH